MQLRSIGRAFGGGCVSRYCWICGSFVRFIGEDIEVRMEVVVRCWCCISSLKIEGRAPRQVFSKGSHTLDWSSNKLSNSSSVILQVSVWRHRWWRFHWLLKSYCRRERLKVRQVVKWR